jgi:hypothetical protein
MNFTYLSVCAHWVHPSACPSALLCVHLSVSLCPSVRVFVSICPCLCVHLSVSVCPSVRVLIMGEFIVSLSSRNRFRERHPLCHYNDD